ncbi:hypothetical protein RYH73_09225 [Olivibacter sp. CPCC 100613]|uniref:DUF6929 family protein n=1 Tax=Olivibacter sp. CPCC 100613 TaxID=3079931 RepID=UPI002FFB7F98
MNIVSSLLILFKIWGINAASGIYYENNQVYVVSDNSAYLYHYNMESANMDKILLVAEQRQELIDKKDKPDFEAICNLGDELMVVGSGSKPNRENAYVYHKKSKKVAKQSLTALYRALREAGGLDLDNFNIEGIDYRDEQWYFLNRGNGPMNKNIVFTFKGGRDLSHIPKKIEVHEVALPQLQNCPTGFSDATIVDNRLYFIATAEDKASTYNDGINKGSYLGYIDLKTWSLGSTRKLSTTQKFEGLTLYKKSDTASFFLLCEDPDDISVLQSPIYSFDFVDQ